MAETAIDFEGNGGHEEVKPNEEVTHLNGDNETTQVGSGNEEVNQEQNETTETPSTGELEVGTTLEIDGATYTVAENGDVVDKDNNVIKKASEVADWLKSFDQVEDGNGDDEEMTIENIIKSVGTSITDEKGGNVEFDNTPAGVKSYIDNVIELRTKEIQEATVNKVFDDMPILKDFANYVIANGGDYTGFGQMPDRSGITVDDNNVEQQKAIVRTAWKEFGKKGDVERYVKYLEDSGQLLETAKEELQAIQDNDAAIKQDIERRANEAREQERQADAAYWNDVRKTIDSRLLMGYKLPENIIIDDNGKKVSKSLNDFYDYLSRPIDKETGATAYQLDLQKVSKENALEKDILDAYLTFTKGSYKDLIDMAVKAEQVKKLVLKVKNNKNTKSVKVIKPTNGKTDINNIVL